MALTVSSLTRCAGFHRWPEAPVHRAYLRDAHRHLFHVRATVEVSHTERDVEFHDLGSFVQLALNHASLPYPYDKTLRDFGTRSCEAIALSVLAYLQGLELEVLEVSVSEDDEYTATWTKDRSAL